MVPLVLWHCHPRTADPNRCKGILQCVFSDPNASSSETLKVVQRPHHVVFIADPPQARHLSNAQLEDVRKRSAGPTIQTLRSVLAKC